jgi:uncharacterized protein YlxW (UPF0749 family)
MPELPSTDPPEISDDSAAAPPPEPVAGQAVPSGLNRLWAAAVSRPRRGQLIAAALLALLGYAATVQIQLTHASTDFAGQRREDLVELLDSLSGASDRAEQQISELQNTRDDLQSSSSGRAAAIADAQRRLDDLQILAGTTAAVGPGIQLTIADPQHSVTAASLLNGVEELRDAGAEAIQVNHTVRLVQSSWFSGPPGAIVIDGHAVHAPYVIQAIGSAHTLSDAVIFPGGLSDEISSLGGSVNVVEQDSVEVGALHPVEPPQYSHPTGQ